MIGRERVLDIANRTLRSVAADEVEVMLLAEQFALTRYSNSAIHQNIERDDLLISVRAIVNDGLGQAYTYSAEPASLRAACERAVELARASRGTAKAGFSPGGQVAELHTFYDTTAGYGPAERASAVCQMAAIAQQADFVIHGAFQVEQSEMAVVTTAGAEQYVPLTMAAVRVAVASTEGGSGFAEAVSRDVTQIKPDALALRAREKCRLNRDRVSLPPGEYTTILEEPAVADLVRFFGTLGLNGEALQQGRSFAKGRIGEQVLDPRITLRDDPWDPRGLVMPFDPEGTPKRPLTLIEGGVLHGVVHDLSTAAEAGTYSTGHAAPPDPEAMMGYPAPTHMFLSGGNSSLDEMIATTERGVLVTRLHYTNSPDPQRLVVTGTTRDGTYLVKEGRITRALHNQRFTQSLLDMLNNLDAIGRDTRLQRDNHGGAGVSMQHGVVGANAHHVPVLKVRRFRFIGESPVV